MLHQKLLDLAFGGIDIFDAPDRSPVAEVIAKHYRIQVPGAGKDFWKADETPYMVEPMNESISRKHKRLVFVGPARSGKSVALINGLIVYTIRNRPVDFAVIRSSRDNAKHFSDTELDRMHQENPDLLDLLGSTKRDDGTFRKRYKSGIVGLLSWPSASVFAEKTIALMLLTDVGKWLANIDGHGSGPEQAQKRTQTLGSNAMTIEESSPGSVWIDPAWTAGRANSHELPPTSSGVYYDIIPQFNAGDRRWWYVPCQGCGEYYPQNACITRFAWPDPDKHKDAAEQGGTVCTACGEIQGEKTKYAENINGHWLKDGQAIDCYGKITGDPVQPSYPSFSLGGGAAKYQSRHEIIEKLIRAERIRDAVGDETLMQGVVNGDIGAPHKLISAGEIRSAHPLMARAENMGKWEVPAGVRFLIATVDIQKMRFVAQVHGYGIGESGKFERWVIDRYNIKNSARTDPADDDKRLQVQPQIYLEDWEQLTPLINKSYPLADGSGRRMSIMTVFCDSGGEAGVTLRAYDYWRSLKLREGNLHNRFRLLKGASHKTAKLIEETLPNTSGRRDRGASRGDVPVFQINTEILKDRLAHDLNRADPGDGYTHFPKWLKLWWYQELTREQRTADGWVTMSPNEAWILMIYADAAAIWGPVNRFKRHPNGLSKIDWEAPPDWAKDWDDNPYVSHPDDGKDAGQKAIDVSQLMF